MQIMYPSDSTLALILWLTSLCLALAALITTIVRWGNGAPWLSPRARNILPHLKAIPIRQSNCIAQRPTTFERWGDLPFELQEHILNIYLQDSITELVDSRMEVIGYDPYLCNIWAWVERSRFYGLDFFGEAFTRPLEKCLLALEGDRWPAQYAVGTLCRPSWQHPLVLREEDPEEQVLVYYILQELHDCFALIYYLHVYDTYGDDYEPMFDVEDRWGKNPIVTRLR